MPIPKPAKGEERSKFVSRCISFAVREGMPQNQVVAACHDIWRRDKGIKKELSANINDSEEPTELLINAIKVMEEE